MSRWLFLWVLFPSIVYSSEIIAPPLLKQQDDLAKRYEEFETTWTKIAAGLAKQDFPKKELLDLDSLEGSATISCIHKLGKDEAINFKEFAQFFTRENVRYFGKAHSNKYLYRSSAYVLHHFRDVDITVDEKTYPSLLVLAPEGGKPAYKLTDESRYLERTRLLTRVMTDRISVPERVFVIMGNHREFPKTGKLIYEEIIRSPDGKGWQKSEKSERLEVELQLAIASIEANGSQPARKTRGVSARIRTRSADWLQPPSENAAVDWYLYCW